MVHQRVIGMETRARSMEDRRMALDRPLRVRGFVYGFSTVAIVNPDRAATRFAFNIAESPEPIDQADVRWKEGRI